MTKKDARSIAKFKRIAFLPHEIEGMQIAIEKKFKSLVIPEIHFLQSYFPMENAGEVNPSEIVQNIINVFPQVVLSMPKLKGYANMDSIEVNAETVLCKNQFGILEPVSGTLIECRQIDLVLIPLLAFDLEGNRVGFGKGYYDRFLAQCRKDVIKIGLSFLDPVSKISDINPFDIPLSYCITPKMVYAFK